MEDFGYQKNLDPIKKKNPYHRYFILLLLVFSVGGFVLISGEAYHFNLFRSDSEIVKIVPPEGEIKIYNDQQDLSLEDVNTSAVYEEIFGDSKVDEKIDKTVVITQPEPELPIEKIVESVVVKNSPETSLVDEELTKTEISDKNNKNSQENPKEQPKQKTLQPETFQQNPSNSNNLPMKTNNLSSKIANNNSLKQKINNSNQETSGMLYHLNKPSNKSQIITQVIARDNNSKESSTEKLSKEKSEQEKLITENSMQETLKKQPELNKSKNFENKLNKSNNGIIVFNKQNNIENNQKILILDNRKDPLLAQNNKKQQIDRKKSKKIMVQIAAMSSKASTEKLWKQINKDNPKFFNNLSHHIEEINLGKKGIFYRLQVGAFSSKGEAENFCGKYLVANKKKSADCLLIE